MIYEQKKTNILLALIKKSVEYFINCLTKLLLDSLCLNRQFQKSKSLHVDKIQIYFIVTKLLSNRRCKIMSLPANTNNTLVKRPINIFLLLYHLVFCIIDFLFTCGDNNGQNKYYECLTIKRSFCVNIVRRPLLLWPVWKQIGIRIFWSGLLNICHILSVTMRWFPMDKQHWEGQVLAPIV